MNRPGPMREYCHTYGYEIDPDAVGQQLVGMVADADGVAHPMYQMTCPYCGSPLGYSVPST